MPGSDPPADESALIDRARRGDEAACAAIVRRHQEAAYRLAYRITGNDADARDAVQDAFVRAFRSLDRFDGRARFGTWLHRIVVNCALNLRRGEERRRSRDDIVAAEEASGAPSPERAAGDRERARAVQAAMEALPPPMRAALALVVLEGYSYKEAAEILDVPPGTVAWRVHEARKRLKEQLRDRIADASSAGGDAKDEADDGLRRDASAAIELR